LLEEQHPADRTVANGPGTDGSRAAVADARRTGAPVADDRTTREQPARLAARDATGRAPLADAGGCATAECAGTGSERDRRRCGDPPRVRRHRVRSGPSRRCHRRARRCHRRGRDPLQRRRPRDHRRCHRQARPQRRVWCRYLVLAIAQPPEEVRPATDRSRTGGAVAVGAPCSGRTAPAGAAVTRRGRSTAGAEARSWPRSDDR